MEKSCMKCYSERMNYESCLLFLPMLDIKQFLPKNIHPPFCLYD